MGWGGGVRTHKTQESRGLGSVCGGGGGVEGGAIRSVPYACIIF